jgi:3-oxoacyl-[acyl-carrier protein] reductase
MDFVGKTAIVTGGSRGIGKATALKLAELGANVVINYTSSSERADAVVEEIKKTGRESFAIKTDVSKFEEVQSFIKKVEERFSTIDILVNNAGVTRDNLLIRMKEEEWDQVILTNLKGTYNCTKAVIRKMLRQRNGKIVNIASVAGVIGNVGQANYAASKAGIIGFTKSIAKELASRGINVNAVAPGFIQTDMTDILSDEAKQFLIEQIPMKQLGVPEDVANLIVFLCSDSSKYITGQVIHVDGGMVM